MRNNFSKMARGVTSTLSKFLLFAFLFLLGVQNNMSAQTEAITISGTVKDTNGEPLIGAAVRIKNTTKGLITNFDGEFKLQVPSKKTVLLVSYSGMKSQEITVGSKKVFDIVLKEDNNVLNEVVVVAMGLEKKLETLTYATQKIKNEDLMIAQDPNFINSLQGRASGLSITPNAGGAGGSSKILLRGNKSITGENQPLIVIDGIPMSNPVQGKIGSGEAMGYGFSTEGSDALSSINPEDIENVNVLKGANAAALYGSRASNGVLMITTKQGKEGKLSIKVSSNATVETPLLLPKFQNVYGSDVNLATNTVSASSWGKKMADYTDAELVVGDARMRREGKNDAREFFQLGTTFNNSFSFSGGTKKVKSYLSYGNTRSNGMIQNNTFMRHSLAFRQSYSFFKDILNINVSFNYVNQNTKNRPGGGTNQNPIYHLYTTTRSADLDYYKENYMRNGKWKSNYVKHLKEVTSGTYEWVYERVDLEGPRQNWLFDAADQNNPYWLTDRVNRTDHLERVYGNVAVNVKITDDLKARVRYSIDRGKTEKIDKLPATTQYPTSMMDYGVYRQWLSNSNEYYIDGLLSYNKIINDISISTSFGGVSHKSWGGTQGLSEIATYYDYSNLRVPTAINVFSPKIGSGGSRTYYKDKNWDQALFFTGQLGYKDFLFVEGSYREDWYRAFLQFNYTRGTPTHYGYYSFGANALVHKFVKLPSYFSNLKIRTSYSEVGNSIPNVQFKKGFVSAVTGTTVSSPYGYYENPIPEKMKSFEAGFDMSFFRNSLNWDMTFYNTTMNHNYLVVQSGGGKQIPVNTGIIRNIGVETNISYGLNLTKDLFWRSGINFSFNDNKIEKTYIDPKTGKEALIAQNIGFGGKFQLKYKKGGRYGDLYATDFKRDENGQIKLSGDGKPLLSGDKFGKYIGNMNSKYLVGWNNSFKYKNFKLNLLFDGKIGGKVVSFTEAYLDRLGLSQRTADARLAAEKDPTLRFVDDEGDEYPALRMEDGRLAPIQKYYEGIGGDINATQYVYDATNVRLRELSLGYTFKNLLGNRKNLSVSLIARNLFFIYVDAPVDPDTSLSTGNGLGGFDIFNMPSARSVGFSASLSL